MVSGEDTLPALGYNYASIQIRPQNNDSGIHIMNRYVLLLIAYLSVMPAAAQEVIPMLAAITGAGVCTASSPDQASKKATINLLQTGSGFRVLKVETEEFIARGPAAQAQEKKTGRVAYFLGYGNAGSIAVVFRRNSRGKVKSKLYINKTAHDPETQRSERQEEPESKPEQVRYEYSCVKKE